MSLEILTALCTLLLGGNVFFIKRLVDKIEATDSAVKLLPSQIENKIDTKINSSSTTLEGKINGVGNQLREIKAEIKDLRRVELDVAVLKSHFGMKPSRHNTDGTDDE